VTRRLVDLDDDHVQANLSGLPQIIDWSFSRPQPVSTVMIYILFRFLCHDRTFAVMLILVLVLASLILVLVLASLVLVLVLVLVGVVIVLVLAGPLTSSIP